MKTADEFFKEKFGNELQANENWVTKFAEEYADKFKPKWISVEEYLPTQEGDYLITDGNSQFVSNYENSNWYFFGVNFWTANEVTHWMPLPTTPEQ